MKNLIKKLMILTLLVSVFIACEKDEIPDGQGEVTVKVTDAPFPFEFVTEANVGIAKIELKNLEGEYVTVFEAGGSSNSNYNMVEFTNGTTATLNTKAIDKGTYLAAKVTLDAASVHLQAIIIGGDEKIFDLSTEAEGSYEVVIDPALEIEEGISSELLLDIDVNNTFQFFGIGGFPFGDWIQSQVNIEGCHFNADFRVCDLNQTGEIGGTVYVGDTTTENAHVYITENDVEIAASHSKNDGSFKFIGVKEGTYSVYATTKNGGSAYVTDIQVSANGTATCTININ